MSILDGFNFWLGKALSEFALFVGFFLGFCLMIGALSFMDWLSRRKK